MSEAVNSNHDSASPRSDDLNPSAVPAFESSASMAAETEEDWQTVDFPGAIPITDLLQSPALSAGTPGATSPAPAIAFDQKASQTEVGGQEPQNLPSLVHFLRGENSSLRNQIVQLEQDLAQVQIELQLEVARFYCKAVEDETADPATGERAAAEASPKGVAQAQSQQLTQNLERSEQTVQQQQQLIDTLTEQLATSQERIAHLERDCALSQQRYAEQVQLASQMENTCRDLRMRLHRQQQQTLQFKAALEKSLEMPPVIGSDHIVSSEPLIISPDADLSESAAFIPKAQPVKPWSKTPEAPGTRSHAASPRSPGKELPNLLKLFNTDPVNDDLVDADLTAHSHPSDVLGSDVMGSDVMGAEGASVDLTTPPAELLALAQSAIVPGSPTPTQSDTPDLDALFPDVPPIPIVADPPSQEAIFDLSPFVEAGEVDPATIATVHPVSPTETIDQPAAPEPPPAASNSAPAPLPENNLWADLARLIEPEMVTENAAIAPDLTIEVESQAIEPFPSLQRPAPQHVEAIEVNELALQVADPVRSAEPAPSPQLVNPFAQPSLETVWVAEVQPGSPFITLKSSPEVRDAAIGSFQEPAIPTVNSLEPSAAESSPGLPSPVLHPFRPTKKLKSMASVELPSFPRTAP